MYEVKTLLWIYKHWSKLNTLFFLFFFFILAPLAIFAKSCLHLRPYALTSLCFLLQSPNFTIYNSEKCICIHYWIHKLCTWDAAVPTELIGTPVLSFKVSLSIQFIESWCICCFVSKKSVNEDLYLLVKISSLKLHSAHKVSNNRDVTQSLWKKCCCCTIPARIIANKWLF